MSEEIIENVFYFEIDAYNEVQTSLLLQMKDWCRHFNRDETKLSISKALNEAVVKTKTKIKAYWITNWQVYLVLVADEKGTHVFLNRFYKFLLEELAKSVESCDQVEGGYEVLNYHMFEHLFSRYPFYNYRLQNLLLGKTVKQPYYIPERAYLKAKLDQSNYCSVINYQGGKGPVLVNTIEDFE